LKQPFHGGVLTGGGQPTRQKGFNGLQNHLANTHRLSFLLEFRRHRLGIGYGMFNRRYTCENSYTNNNGNTERRAASHHDQPDGGTCRR
jgi:hypothetical protein